MFGKSFIGKPSRPPTLRTRGVDGGVPQSERNMNEPTSELVKKLLLDIDDSGFFENITTIFVNISRKCVSASAYKPLTIGEIDYFIQHYVFPMQLFLGTLGNAVNLVVLLSSSMKSQVRGGGINLRRQRHSPNTTGHRYTTP